MAYGQAAMLLSLGFKGKRGVLPNSISMLLFLSFLTPFATASVHAYIMVLNIHHENAAKLHLPKVHKSGGAAIDMWIKVRLNFISPTSQHPTLGYACTIDNYCTFVLNILFCNQAKELDTNTDYYLDLLSKGVGKPKEELAEFLKGPRYFRAQEAIDYGLADTILHSLDGSFKPKVSCYPSFTIGFHK